MKKIGNDIPDDPVQDISLKILENFWLGRYIYSIKSGGYCASPRSPVYLNESPNLWFTSW